MDTKRLPEEINHDRRRLVGAAVMTLAAAELGMPRSAEAQSSVRPDSKRSASTPMGPIKQIEAGVLNVGYFESGPAGGRPVMLLHGWPYDIHMYVGVAPILAAAGYRV